MYLNWVRDLSFGAGLLIRLPTLASSKPHIPDPLTWDGLLILLFLINYFELHSALVDWDYATRGDLPAFEASIKNRSRARSIAYWFFSTHTLQLPMPNNELINPVHAWRPQDELLSGDDAVRHIYFFFLAWQAQVLIDLKRAAWKYGSDGENVVTTKPTHVLVAVELCLKNSGAWDTYMELDIEESKRSFAWPGPVYRIHKSDPVDLTLIDRRGHVAGDELMASGLGLAAVPVPWSKEMAMIVRPVHSKVPQVVEADTTEDNETSSDEESREESSSDSDLEAKFVTRQANNKGTQGQKRKRRQSAYTAAALTKKPKVT
ncbi:hypothetical protein DXG01_009482 [Tephrocybe rancida]|nr:hypothetical protein DXG01_009482 [Tephrocybe rancida]